MRQMTKYQFVQVKYMNSCGETESCLWNNVCNLLNYDRFQCFSSLTKRDKP
jgi:hypothetical protein